MAGPTQAVRAIMAAAAVALACSEPGMALLVVVGVSFGVIDALHMPALGSLPPRMLTADQLPAGQGLIQVVQRVVWVAAAPLGGAVAVGGLLWVTAMNAALFAVAFLVFRSVPADLQLAATRIEGRGEDGDVRSERRHGIRGRWIGHREQAQMSSPGLLVEGLRFAWSDVVIRAVLMTVTVLNLVAAGTLNVGVAQLVQVRAWGAQGFGLVMAGFAAGAVAGALIVSAARPARHPVRTGLVWTLLGGIALGFTGVPTHLPLAIGCAAALGVAVGPASALLLGTVQACCPADYLGRVMSLVGFSAVGLAPVSMVIFGQIADRIGVSLAFPLAGGALALTAVTALTSRVLRNATAPVDLSPR